MHPKTKATKVTKKGKSLRDLLPQLLPSTQIRNGGKEEEVSVKSLLSNMSSMLMALTARVDGLDSAAEWRTVSFQEAPPASSVTTTSDASGAPPGGPAPSTSQER